jgi:hypothetical protein
MARPGQSSKARDLFGPKLTLSEPLFESLRDARTRASLASRQWNMLIGQRKTNTCTELT